MQTSARLSQKLKAVGEAPAFEPFDVGIAQTPIERLAAARLVGSMYMSEGYLAETKAPTGEAPAFYALHHLLDETLVFVARDTVTGKIVGAMAMVIDSPAGLPMDALYREDLDRLRSAGKKLCEFCSLAVDPKLGSRSTGLLLALFRAAYRCAYYALGVDDVCVTLKPSHAGFYKRVNFERFGGVYQDLRFKNADTIAMRLPGEAASELWTSGEAHAPRNRLRAYCSEPLTPAERKALRNARLRARRSALEIRTAILRRPSLLKEATPVACIYLERTLRKRKTIVQERSACSTFIDIQGKPVEASAAHP